MIDPNTLHFLEDLAKNNEKEWFHENRGRYEEARANFIDFSSEVLEQLKTIQDDLLNTEIKKCILRINRDIRFTKDKRPYKNYFGAGFGPGGSSSGRSDFYLQIEPGGKSFLGGGMWSPSPENMAKWRQEIDYNPDALKSIIYAPEFKNYFKEIAGQQLKTKPKGYEIDHPEIDLLKYKELFFYRYYSDEEVCSENFSDEIFKACKLMKPYQDYVNELFFDS
ncbi:DUF2461 domain-containing protein [Jiulongibacter sediminis]|uniref:DUF2461 domain-containing protein n=1 Tax=Jiulongibacter sediminis TaxID=1605367 RepID=UPI0026ED2157|nr:DUF2461 domain-containing protein [Jiulongibacter sediminis]